MKLIHPLRILTAILTVLFLLVAVGCKTTPDDDETVPEPEKPVEEVEQEVEPKVEPKVDVTPDSPDKEAKPAPLSQEDIDAARAAVRRANLMGANRYHPTEYRALADGLNAAIALGDADPDSARDELRRIIADANDLYDLTLMTRRAEYEEKYYRSDRALKAIEADKHAPAEYSAIPVSALAAVALFDAGDYAGAQEKADETLESQARLYFNLSENIRYVGILRRDTENYLGDAEDNEAFIYAVDELGAANDNYLKGVSEFRNYDIESSVNTLTEAKRWAVLAARTSAVRKQQSETDRLMAETQRRLESASTLRTLDNEGAVRDARPWDGNEYLSSNPLIDHSENVGEVDIEGPELRSLDAPVGTGADGSPIDIPIEDAGTQVNADEQATDYLTMAKVLWEKGVNARNDGQFDLAGDYFRQAQAYIDVYESNAVFGTYTVVYRKVRTDALWRIAERPEIFDNPFLWPKIWRANRRMVQNPDLIYPGQVLTIPPK